MANNRDITIYDIANELNLSSSTVSRALKNHRSISKKTIERVNEMANKMGYTPNVLASSLRNNKSKTIGVLISRINRPFMASLISGIEETAQKAGYNVIITQSHDSYEDEVNMAQALYNSRVSGIICSLAMETTKTNHFEQFMEKDIPLVFVDRVPKDFDTYRVMIDNYSAGYKATNHLIEMGARRIAHIGGLKFRNIYKERERGYRDALKEHNLPVEEDLIQHVKTMSYEEGEKATNKLLDMDNPPDGIFSSNDTTGVAAIQVAKQRGLIIPDELKIIGFNNDPLSQIIDPGLSTISHPAYEMGKTSSKKILKHLKHSEKKSITEITFLNTEIIVRGSTKSNN
ncbi:LacI family DNA-binding transcriptional regulator [Winogradskyella sp. SYSU M77433]|uniref:LacI family DNA-binding transcriptional regulator n=1 Tax=Winogradskyella sp. SYSU M77433 TaxID=3042722 RepID=UPI002480A51C|nr:LacI family DNA-binding transcriptional regulator [Winogradskyella sp. SYSU M77433]MDH7911704.1 LacI family DNA-binding transcriptional regulator [Winogradskyella sp. SYSU M77433]